MMELDKFLFPGEEIDHKALRCLKPMITDQYQGLDPVDMTGYKIARCETKGQLMTGFVRPSSDKNTHLVFVNAYKKFITNKTPRVMVGFCYAKPTDMFGDMLPIECIKTKPRLALEALKSRLNNGVL